MASAAGGKVLAMRRLFSLLALVVVLLVPFLALSQVTLTTGLRSELTDCASGGSSSTTLVAGVKYLFRVTDSDVFLCFAATCAAGGEKFPMGTVMLLRASADQTTISCRSSASTGDVIFTSVQ